MSEAKLPDRIYLIDPLDDDGQPVENTGDVCWCADPVGNVNAAYIAEATVTAALRELRAKLQPGLFWTEGTHRTAMAELDATIAKLGLAESQDCPECGNSRQVWRNQTRRLS